MRYLYRFLSLLLLSAALPSAHAVQSTGGAYTLTKQSIAGGGGTSQQGIYSLVDSVAQPVAGAASGGNFQLISGFHPAPEETLPDTLLHDGFEN
jgi:hypothetical protein